MTLISARVSACDFVVKFSPSVCVAVRDLFCEQPALVCHGLQSHSVDPSVWSWIVKDSNFHERAFSTRMCANLKCSYVFVRSI